MTGQAPEQDQPVNVWTLRLYVAGENQKSRTALTNLTRLCELHIGKGRYDIEIPTWPRPTRFSPFPP